MHTNSCLSFQCVAEDDKNQKAIDKAQRDCDKLVERSDEEVASIRRKLEATRTAMEDERRIWQNKLLKVYAELDTCNDKLYGQKKRNKEVIASHVARQKGELRSYSHHRRISRV